MKFIKSQGFLYLVVGGATTAVNFVVYSLLVYFSLCSVLVSNAIAWCVAVLFAYFTNKHFVFASHDYAKFFKEFYLFVLARSTSGVVEIFAPSGLIYIGLDARLFDIEGFWAKFIVSVFVVLANYFFSKYLIFKKD